VNILIVKLSAIGDVIHTLPALNAIRQYYPEAHITWLVEETAAGLVVGHPALDRVIVVPRKTWIDRFNRRHLKQTIPDIFRFVRRIRDTRYQLVLDFQALLKSSIWIALARGDRKVGFGRGMEHMESSWLFLNERIPPIYMEVHALDRGLHMLRAIGIPADVVAYRLPIREPDRRGSQALLDRVPGNLAGPLLAMNPAAKWETKLWERRKFSRLADRIIDAYGARILFTGASEDCPMIDAIIGDMQHPALNVAGRTSLMELAALFEGVAAVVTTDTGPMHLAAAVGTPTIALFGPTAPWRTGPHGSGHRIVRSGLPCSPCYRRDCAHPECMTNITVDQVMDACHSVLAATRQDKGKP